MTNEELERAVDRAMKKRDHPSSDTLGFTTLATADFDTIMKALSERAELLAAVERMREELDVAAVHLQLAGGWLREAGDDGQRANELLRASNRIRAALTAGEGK